MQSLQQPLQYWAFVFLDGCQLPSIREEEILHPPKQRLVSLLESSKFFYLDHFPIEMEPLNLFVASLNFTRAETFSAGFYKLAADRSLLLTWLQKISESWSWDQWSKEILQWLSRPGE